MRTSTIFSLSVSTALAFLTVDAQAVIYTVRDLGTVPNGLYSYGYDVNNAGAVVGYALDAGTRSRAVAYGSGGPSYIGPLAGDSDASAINASGQVTVNGVSASGQNRGHLYSNGVLTDLGALPGGSASYASSLNNAAQVVGSTYYGNTGKSRATVYSNGVLTDLGTLSDGTESYASDINNLGQVVGRADTRQGSAYTAFVYANGAMTALGTLPGFHGSSAAAINDHGVVAGVADTFTSHSRAFITSDAGLLDLGTLGGEDSYAYDINNLNQVVGFAEDIAGDSRPFLYSNGQMQDLNALLDPTQKAGVFLEYAYGINDAGQITGTGLFNGKRHAFLLTPSAVPEPGTLALMLAGMLGVWLVGGARMRALFRCWG